MTNASNRVEADGPERGNTSGPRAIDVDHVSSHQSSSVEDAARADRAVAAWEIVSVTMSVLIGEWVVLALVGDESPLMLVPIALAFALMLLSHHARGETRRALGFRLDNFARAARLLALPTLAAVLLLLFAGWLTGSINFMRWRGGWALVGLPTFGVVWGLVQQYALQGFFNRRAQLVLGRGAASVLVVAALFALLHLPNPALAAATFAGGLLWAAVYQREPNLPALALSHGLMTWVLISTLPPQLLGGLRVGYKYFL
jgi:membrane protease YdiL (CAAX protease family)